MDKLVAEGVKAVDQPAEQRRCVATSQGQLGCAPAAGEAAFQSAFIDFAAPVIPEALAHTGYLTAYGCCRKTTARSAHQCIYPRKANKAVTERL